MLFQKKQILRRPLLLAGWAAMLLSLNGCMQSMSLRPDDPVTAAYQKTSHFCLFQDDEDLEPALKALSVADLARYVTLLAEGGTPSGYEEAIVLAFEVADENGTLAALKYAIDYDNDGYSVVRLLAHDVDCQTRVKRIQKLLNKHAGDSAVGIKLLSDVDDTIYPNLVDPRYARDKENPTLRYPGARALYRAIAEEPAGVRGNRTECLTLTTLSARPETRIYDAVKSSLEGVSPRLGGICASSLGGEIVSSTLGTLYTLSNAKLPSDADLIEYDGLSSANHRSPADKDFMARQETKIGKVKFENYQRFIKIYPEYDYVFFGDSGQADAVAAMKIMQHNTALSEVPGRALVTFIHDLRLHGKEGEKGMSPTDDVKLAMERKDKDIILFRNHVQAALLAYRWGNEGRLSRRLVDAKELVAVVEEALDDLDSIEFKTDPQVDIEKTVKAAIAEDAMQALQEARAADSSLFNEGLWRRMEELAAENRV